MMTSHSPMKLLSSSQFVALFLLVLRRSRWYAPVSVAAIRDPNVVSITSDLSLPPAAAGFLRRQRHFSLLAPASPVNAPYRGVLTVRHRLAPCPSARIGIIFTRCTQQVVEG
ncbi:hypothetical protein O9993_09750 [Vibrio lentus]|nr:hypothetical protein [Vibrio lentus]